MQRVAFLKAITTVNAALGRGDILAALANLWFDGETVSAFDENVGICTTCEFELVGGIKGDKLLGMVSKTTVKNAEVLVTTDGSNATIKIGKRVTVKVAVDEPANRLWTPEAPNPASAIKVRPELLVDGLSHCLKSVGQDLGQPEHHGVTFEADKDSLRIYTGFAQVCVEAIVPIKAKPAFTRVVLPEKFCQHVLRHIGTKGAVLELHNDKGGLLTAPDITVYGRSLSGGTGVNMRGAIANARKGTNGAFMKLPSGVGRMLDRAALFEGDHLNMRLDLERCKGGMRLRMISGGKASGAELVDVSAAIAADVEPIKVLTNAKHLMSGALLTEFDINSNRILLQGTRDGVQITQAVSAELPR